MTILHVKACPLPFHPGAARLRRATIRHLESSARGMPRISPAHEQQVRDRIIAAAVSVFAEKGYHRATISDVVQRSGLSVGAIYTHFRNKEELFLHSCDQLSSQGLDEM